MAAKIIVSKVVPITLSEVRFAYSSTESIDVDPIRRSASRPHRPDALLTAVPCLIGFVALLALVAATLTSFGCASAPQSVRPVLANARDAQSRLALSYAEDLKGYRRVVAANLAAQRIAIVGEVRREFISRDYVVEKNGVDVADPAALARDVADPTITTAIVEDVRVGRLSVEQAGTFLRDYAALGSLSTAADARSKMLATLSRVARFDAAVKELDAAFDTHAEHVASLFSETGASLDAVAMLADKPDAAEYLTSRETWSSLIGAIVKNPKQQTAILDAISASGPFVGGISKPSR